MSAILDPASPAQHAHVVDLRHVDARGIDPLLREETSGWNELLEWEFGKSADLVRRFIDLHALSGCALIIGEEVAGYAYYVEEEHKGLVGDLYVRRRFRTAENETLLLGWIVDAMTRAPGLRRIESQLMMIESDPRRVMPCAQWLQIYERNFMRVDLRQASIEPGRLARPVFFERWSDRFQDGCARVIASAYQHHVDSLINDQYRSVNGARRFLFNIVQYPGCGTFFQPAAFVALDCLTGQPCGLSLTSLVSPQSGHITQICVMPELRGTGLGYALLRQSLAALREHGCRTASLTVTASNANAVGLYERVGFTTARRFSACIWEGWPVVT